MQAAKRRWLRLGGVVIGLAGLWGLLRAAGVNWLDLHPEALRAFVLSFGWAAPVTYLMLFGQPVVPLPVSAIAMAGGLAFGAVPGAALAWAAAWLRACGQFLIARVVGREAFAPMLKRRLPTFDDHLGRRGFATVLWVRLVPNVPYDLQNVGFGCSNVRFGAFASATAVGIVPGLILWVTIGHALTTSARLWNLVALLIGVGALWYLQVHSRKRDLRAPS
jgi:uncharacterized membrane protein YdjX (TVP38/TMEM64 family)